jgi:hypothetical protein
VGVTTLTMEMVAKWDNGRVTAIPRRAPYRPFSNGGGMGLFCPATAKVVRGFPCGADGVSSYMPEERPSLPLAHACGGHKTEVADG